MMDSKVSNVQSMQIPHIFWGKYRQAKLQCRKAAKRLVQGESFDDAINGSMLDIASTPGLLVFKRCDSSLDSLGENFYCYLLLDEIRELTNSLKLEQALKIEDRCFQESLHSAWGTLGLVATNNWGWTNIPYRISGPDLSRRDEWIAQKAYPMLDACLQYWDLFCAVGKRYTMSLPEPQEIWNVSNNLYGVLFNLGLPKEEIAYPQDEQIFFTKIYKPLTTERLQEIVGRLKQKQ
jgi:hypothetical protein